MVEAVTSSITKTIKHLIIGTSKSILTTRTNSSRYKINVNFRKGTSFHAFNYRDFDALCKIILIATCTKHEIKQQRRKTYKTRGLKPAKLYSN